jgi:hypothetical protein
MNQHSQEAELPTWSAKHVQYLDHGGNFVDSFETPPMIPTYQPRPYERTTRVITPEHEMGAPRTPNNWEDSVRMHLKNMVLTRQEVEWQDLKRWLQLPRECVERNPGPSGIPHSSIEDNGKEDIPLHLNLIWPEFIRDSFDSLVLAGQDLQFNYSNGLSYLFDSVSCKVAGYLYSVRRHLQSGDRFTTSVLQSFYKTHFYALHYFYLVVLFAVTWLGILYSGAIFIQDAAIVKTLSPTTANSNQILENICYAHSDYLNRSPQVSTIPSTVSGTCTSFECTHVVPDFCHLRSTRRLSLTSNFQSISAI